MVGLKDRAGLSFICSRTRETGIPAVRPGPLTARGEQHECLYRGKSDLDGAGQPGTLVDWVISSSSLVVCFG